MTYEEIAAAVVVRRRALRLTQDETAALAGIDRRTLSEFENSAGTRGITVRNLLGVCAVLGLTLEVEPFTGRNELA